MCKKLLPCLPHVFFLVALFATFWKMYWQHKGMFVFYMREDRMMESLQFFSELLCASLCCYIALEFRRRSDAPNQWMFVLGALVFTFVGLEEISWGQRLFMFELPEYFAKNNLQHESNLHNISGISNKKLHLIVGLYGVLSLAVYVLARPFLLRTKLPIITQLRLDLCVIPVPYICYFIPLILYNQLYGWLASLNTDISGLYFQEVAEFSFALGCYLTLSYRLRMLLRER